MEVLELIIPRMAYRPRNSVAMQLFHGSAGVAAPKNGVDDGKIREMKESFRSNRLAESETYQRFHLSDVTTGVDH